MALLKFRVTIAIFIGLFTAQVVSAQCEAKKGLAKKLCEAAQIGIPHPDGHLREKAIAEVKAAALVSVGTAMGDGLPIKLDATHVLPAVEPPVDFHPAHIHCTADNTAPLQPGDYSCEVLLYCMKDSDHRAAPNAPYGLAPLEGKMSVAIATLLNRGSATGVSPMKLQAVTWANQASIPLSQLPQDYQDLVHQLLPEPDLVRELEGDFLQQLTSTYDKYRLIPGMPSLDAILNEIGQPGRLVQSIRRSNQIIRQDTLNFERMQERLYDGPAGQQVLQAGGTPPSSRWAEIRPGVIAQLVVTGGNLHLNTLNFRVLPHNAARLSRPTFVNASYSQSELSSGDVITIIEIIGGIAQPETAPGLLGDILRRRFGRALIGYALYGIQTQALMMSMPPSGNSPGPCDPHNFDKYVQNAAQPLNSSGISKAGSALQSHSTRGQGFPVVTGPPSVWNAAAQQLIEEILTSPTTSCTQGNSSRQGDYVQFQLPNGIGARWTLSGEWIGFIGP